MPRPTLPKSEKRSKIVRVCLTPGEYAIIRAASGKAAPWKWVRVTLLAAAKK